MAEGGDASFSSGSELIFDFFCELCIDDNKQVEAEGYCVDCREYLCGSCYSGHGKSRPTQHHVLQDKNNMPKDTPLSTDIINKDITTKCQVHSGRPLKYYCKSHAVLGCSTCFVSGHRGCSDIENIIDISENLLVSQLYKDAISKLQLIQKKSRDIEKRARENKTLSQKCYTDVVSMVRTLKEEVIVMLNEIEQNTVTLAKKMLSENEEKIESVVEDFKVLSEIIEQVSSDFESLKASKRVCQLYINMRETEGEVKTIQEKLNMLEETNVVNMIRFEPNAELTSLLRNPDILGTISHHLQHVRTPSPVNATDPSSTTAKHLEDISVRSSSDTIECYISGSAVLSSNRLIITDYTNKNIKLVDTQTNSLLSELKVPSQPWDITVFNKTQAAVTLRHSKKILMLKDTFTERGKRNYRAWGMLRCSIYIQPRKTVGHV